MHIHINSRKVRIDSLTSNGIISHDLMKSFASSEGFTVTYKKRGHGEEEKPLFPGEQIKAEEGMEFKINNSTTAEEYNPLD